MMGWTTTSRRLRRVTNTLVTVALTFIGLTAITFSVGRIIPVDPVAIVVGERAPPDVYARVKTELGLDRPLWWQYASYLSKLAHGDLGRSMVTGAPVADELKRVFPATLELASAATLLGVVLGVPLGVAAAARRGSWIDHLSRLVALPGYSVPVFWLGLMALLVFYVRLDWAAPPGRAGVAFEGLVPVVTGVLTVDALLAGDMPAFRDAFAHLALPALLLGYVSLSYVSRMTRSMMLDQLGQEYVLAARAKGATQARVIWRHAFPNIRVPLVTVIAISYAQLLEGAVLTETVFSWPGLGQYMTTALFNADLNSVLGATVLIGAVFIVINLTADALYRLLDPRTR
jgi:peptide/nickel transport system permease protein